MSPEDDKLQMSKSIDSCLKYFFRKEIVCQETSQNILCLYPPRSSIKEIKIEINMFSLNLNGTCINQTLNKVQMYEIFVTLTSLVSIIEVSV
jgi:hypothetical protein